MAHRRLSSAEKGKGIDMEPHQPLRTARVKAPIPDNADLIRKHSLTLIGRVTNKSVQKHCTKCLRLDHELKECLVARAEAKAQKAQQIEEPTRMSASSVHEEASTRHRTVTSTKKNRGLNGQAPTNEVLNSLPHQRITFVTEELIRNHKTTHTVGHTSLKP
uniref:Zinc knuckle CX2CX4HX4C domain-containing protein n=1 Tax=Brassica oleracea TaxID=3712 RepID=A0A3P6D2J7_BRAOL|nr:unnamed protein product [Brassica oleracea]